MYQAYQIETAYINGEKAAVRFRRIAVVLWAVLTGIAVVTHSPFGALLPVWALFVVLAAAASGILAALIRCFTKRYSAAALMCAFNGISAVLLTASCLHRMTVAECTCEIATGGAGKQLYFMVPAMLLLSLLCLLTCLIRHRAERKTLAACDAAETPAG